MVSVPPMTNTVAPSSLHPLDPLTGEEIATVAAAVLACGRVGERPQFAWVALREPPKAQVLGIAGGAETALPRQADAVVVDRATGTSYEVAVELGSGEIVSARALEGEHGAMVFDEFIEAQKAVKDPKVWAALQRRGVTDPATVYLEPWPAGWFDRPYDPDGRRLGHCVFYVREGAGDSPWARPVQGLVAVWDRTRHEVVELVDDGSDIPVPSDQGRFGAEHVGPLREDLRPLDVSQPDGPSFTLDGHHLRWQRWQMRVSLHPIEGLVLHQVAYEDPAAGRVRPILYRAAMAEMCVPYGDPQVQHYWRHVFDEGEVGMGRSANPLRLGCDCLGEIRYLDAPMVLPDGSVSTIENAICVHEEDFGVLWRHRDRFTETAEVRRARRLVVSYWATLGNYDYGYFWYFYQDGSIELEVKLTGIPLASAVRPGQAVTAYETRVGPEVSAPHHQHFFSWRLDLDVDGTANVLEEVDLVPAGPGPANPHGNAFRTEVTRLERESVAVRDAEPSAGRVWRVSNPAVRNAYGGPVAYQLVPTATPLLLSSPTSAAGRRAGFAQHHLWATPYAPDEMRAAGANPTQHPGGAGLPAYVAADRSLVEEDLVLWVTLGSNHVSRPEEWPVMPVERVGFALRPAGFFDRNPALDVPPQELVNPGGHCH
ncbi:MAG: primary-amine oxidase [Acidimicrobiia bacterium]|nr:primary-amine oxidase [Acidimicrobiia bacterium]